MADGIGRAELRAAGRGGAAAFFAAVVAQPAFARSQAITAAIPLYPRVNGGRLPEKWRATAAHGFREEASDRR